MTARSHSTGLASAHRRNRRLRILLTGSTGQVGWELSRALQTIGDVVSASHRPSSAEGASPSLLLDLSRPDSIRTAVRQIEPDLIVNAAAYTAVDKAEQEPDLAMTINGLAPGLLAEEAARRGAALVHYSTDYVFDGSGSRPWSEDDPTGPLNVYGRTKLAGEETIRASGAAHLILRVSWVYGVQGANFVRTMLRLGSQKSSLSVVNDQIGAPTSARVIADVTAQILAQGLADPAAFLRERGGVVHCVCGGEASWHGFAKAIFALAKSRGLPLAVDEVRPISSSQYPTPAVRPKNSRLDCRRLAERFSLTPPDWHAALERTFDAMHRPRLVEEPPNIRVASDGAGASIPFERPALRRLRLADFRQSDLDVGVIYTYERQYIARLLSSLSQSAPGLHVRLLLVDNASTDGTAEWERLVPNTVVLRNAERLGYGPNLNRILRASRAPYVLLLNTDMYFDPAEQCLSKMVRFMEDHPECGVSGCRLYHPDGTYGYPARRFQTLRTIVGRRAGLNGVFEKDLSEYLYRERSPHDVFDCDWLSGCFLMVRREAYEEVGDFDCGFAKYFEDVDLCLRMRRAGWRVMFNGGTCCYHCEQRASRRLFSREALRHLRSYSRWLAKWGFDPGRSITPPERRKAA